MHRISARPYFVLSHFSSCLILTPATAPKQPNYIPTEGDLDLALNGARIWTRRWFYTLSARAARIFVLCQGRLVLGCIGPRLMNGNMVICMGHGWNPGLALGVLLHFLLLFFLISYFLPPLLPIPIPSIPPCSYYSFFRSLNSGSPFFFLQS